MRRGEERILRRGKGRKVNELAVISEKGRKNGDVGKL